MPDVERILVVRTDRIGDVILTTPALQKIRDQYPKAHISILLAPMTAPLLEGLPAINEIIQDDRFGAYKGVLGFWRLVSEIKKRRFDVAYVFHTKKRTNSLCFFAGIPKRIGYKNDKFGFLLTDPVKDDRPSGKKHEIQYCLDLVGGEHDKDYPLQVQIQSDAEEWVSSYWAKHFGSEPVIVIHPGASDPSKMWPAKFFVQLIDRLSSGRKFKFLLVGSRSILDISQNIARDSQQEVTNLVGKTDVAQLTSALKRCRMLISNDSGPVHIAAALKIPVVSIFTRNQPGINPERWQPVGPQSRMIGVDPNQDVSFTKAGSAPPEYLELIPVQRVLEEVDALLKL